MRYSIGIDLGATTARVAAASDDGRLHDVGEVPLVVGLTPGGEVAVGSSALTLDEARRASGFRDLLGQPEPLLLGGTPFGVEALIAQVLRSTVDTVASDVGEWPVRIAVAHPDEWGDDHLDLLWQSAAMAEVGEVVLLTDSEARAVDADELSSAFSIARGAARWARPEGQAPPVEPAGLPISGRTAASVLAALAGGTALGAAGATSGGAGVAARIADFSAGRTMADWARGTQSMSDYGGSGSRMSDFGDGKSMSDFGAQAGARAGRRIPMAAIAAAVVVVVAMVAGGIALASFGDDEPDETAVASDTTAPTPTDAPTTTAVDVEDRVGQVPFIFAGRPDNPQRRFEVGETVGRNEVFFPSGVRGVEAADDGRIFLLTSSEGGEIWVVDGDNITLLFRGGIGGVLSGASELTLRGSGDDLEVIVAVAEAHRLARFRPATQQMEFFGNGQTTGELPNDGVSGAEAVLNAPHSVDADALGNVWIIDSLFGAIYRIDRSDRLTVVSGRGSDEPSEGARAADVSFRSAVQIAADGTGGAAVSVGTEIWRIDSGGTVAKMGGTGTHPGVTAAQGDDGPALAAAVITQALAFSPDGDLYIASGGPAHDIRRIDTNGVIRRIAGGHPFNGILPATAHRFAASAIDIDSNGRVYLAEASANLNFLRRLPPEGVPPDTAAIGFSVIDKVGETDDLRGSDGVLDHTLEFVVEGDLADVVIAEGPCGREDPDGAAWDTIIGNRTPGIGVARQSLTIENDATGDLPTVEFDAPTLLVFVFQDDGAIAPGERLCLTIVRPDGEEDETTLVIRGFNED